MVGFKLLRPCLLVLSIVFGYSHCRGEVTNDPIKSDSVEGVSPKYWRGFDGSVRKEIKPRDEIEIEDLSFPDKLQVFSSSLKVLPRRKDRQRRSESSWRKPREYQFVTREKEKKSQSRSARLVEPPRSSSNYYPEDRSFVDNDYYSRRNSPPNRRIIYYATLPEVVRRPGEWTPPRPIYNPYPPVRDNEITRVHSPIIDVTRVQSSVIDVTDKSKFQNPTFPQDLSAPKFTIIDAEPPYNRPRPQASSGYGQNRFDLGGYNQNRFDYNRYDHNRFDFNRYGFNRYDYRNYVEPYKYYSDNRLPPNRHQVLPPQSVVVRKPLDVRPLDPIRDFSTQGPPLSSTQRPSSTSTPSPISSYERSFKY